MDESSRYVPCSMEETPARSAELMPSVPWAWAATLRPIMRAASTMDSSSSSKNC